MLATVLTLAALLVAGLLAVAAVTVLGVRNKWGFVLRLLFGLQRSLMNPSNMKTAGRKGATYSVVRHRGRTSGREYETPVGVVETDEGFLIALPYGQQSNWVRNVLAQGSAEIVHQGRTRSADRPEIVAMRDVVDLFPASDRGAFRVFGVRSCLRLREAGSIAGASAARSLR
jgi:deazaflavin-dependent oxidoreductase (nitroreductase family)